ncbi:ABC transporter substrate-binding protein [Desulfatitalea alkaliphila]|uniref:ABC transporter substrate-binding protein n=1 Tax=Desulfatitalea alkaliphila TaxID=2929485 RepID=A0AA41UIV9_9BACT|nr:ABC transporter substrate-binding protein [Desulfatitalea alkaliphila]MCJ8500519.1 ABC transporter substrate-binding protein [Desulfatitalea alkaliphila]
MTIRRFLIAAPTLLAVALLVSYFWVPSYEDQVGGNPERLTRFITASSGDASMLNPILSADSASSQIGSLVFEGLVDRDEHLAFRGRIARSWRIYAQAYFYINPQGTTRRWGKTNAATLVNGLRTLTAQDDPFWHNITAVDLLPSESLRHTAAPSDNADGEPILLHVTPPPRVRLTLESVDPDLFERLEDELGAGYFDRFDPLPFVVPDGDIPQAQLATIARDILPATAYNPIIQFDLRPGVTFHDGRPVTAEDVRFTYEAIMNPSNLSPRIPDYEPVQAVEVIDPLTVRIVYNRLYSPALGTWSMGILPAHRLNAAALRQEALKRGESPETFGLRQSRFNRNPIGSGPFMFDNWKSDQYIRLKRFTDYWEGAPNYEQYVMRIIPDPLTQEMEFYAGTVDDYAVQPHQVARLRQDERFQHFSGTAFGYSYIGYNSRRPPFDDPRVRRALGMAIDADQIIEYVLYGQAERITGPFVKQTDFYNHDIQPLPYDPQGALDLLAEAGWTRGADGFLQKDGRRMAFTLITNNGNPIRRAILAIAQDAWRKIGIQVETDLLEWSVFIQRRVNQLDFDALVLGWSMGIDPDLYQIWHSSQSGPFQLNFVGFDDPEADDLILQIRREYDHDKQVAACHRLHEIIAAAQPYTFLFVGRWTALLDRRIVRRVQTPDGEIQYKPIEPTITGGYTFHFNQWIKLPQSLEDSFKF